MSLFFLLGRQVLAGIVMYLVWTGDRVALIVILSVLWVGVEVLNLTTPTVNPVLRRRDDSR